MASKNIGWWIVGILLLVISIVAFNESTFAGVLIMAAGLISMPPIISMVRENNVAFRKNHRIFAVVLLFVVGMVILGSTSTIQTSDNSYSENSEALRRSSLWIQIALPNGNVPSGQSVVL